jgi:hypothetical protein
MADMDITDPGLMRRVPGELILMRAIECLGAETMLGNGDVRPDYRVRMDAIKAIMAYAVGRPSEAPPLPPKEAVERPDDYEEKLAASPAMQAALQRMLDRAAKKGGIKKVPAGPPAP